MKDRLGRSVGSVIGTSFRRLEKLVALHFSSAARQAPPPHQAVPSVVRHVASEHAAPCLRMRSWLPQAIAEKL
jgi:hypothetical protein